MELNIGVMVSLLFAGLLVMLLSGVEVAFGLIAVGLIAMYAFLPLNSFGDAARQAWDQLNSSSLSAVVMYIFMGELILKAGISEGIFKSLNRWLPLVKWFLSIPLILVGLIYSVIALGMTFIAWIMTSATGNYPKWAGKFVFKTICFWNRVNGYAFILVSDKYPSFGL